MRRCPRLNIVRNYARLLSHRRSVLRSSFSLRHCSRSYLRQALLSQSGSADRNASRFWNLLHWLRRAAGRGRHFRSLRRSHRPQSDTDCHVALHGACNLRYCFCADFCFDRYMGRDHPDYFAGDSRDRRWRRMGWLRALGDGMVTHARPARFSGFLAALRPMRSP